MVWWARRRNPNVPEDPGTLADLAWWFASGQGNVSQAGGPRAPRGPLPHQPFPNRRAPISDVGTSTELPLPPVYENDPDPRPCPPGFVRRQQPPFDCGRVPQVVDPDHGGTRDCATDDECENPELHRKCGFTLDGRREYWNGRECAPAWTPNPFTPLPVRIASAVLHRLAASFLGDLGSPAPKRAPRPSRRPPPRRRPPPPKRPPARPARPPPVRRTPRTIPNIPGLPADFPSPTLNPIDFILREWQLYTRPLGERSGNRRRGGARTRARFPPMPPISLPAPGPIPVDIPTPARSTPNARPDPFPPAVPSPGRSPAPSPRPAPRPARAAPARLINPLISALLSAPLYGSPGSLPSPRLRPRSQPQPRLRELSQPSSPLTPSQQPGVGLQPGRVTVASPEGNPCEVRVREQRRKQRQRRKQCQKFTTKTIRVCADRS